MPGGMLDPAVLRIAHNGFNGADTALGIVHLLRLMVAQKSAGPVMSCYL
jgi:hypothetical protein